MLNAFVFKVFGGNSEEGTPVPIPNTEVKLFSADGTAWDTTWESRSPPKFILSPFLREGAFFVSVAVDADKREIALTKPSHTAEQEFCS